MRISDWSSDVCSSDLETQLMALDLAGVAVSSGAACSSGKVKPSHVLSAMGSSDSDAGSAIRVSLGWASTPADIDHLLAAWGDLYRRRQAACGKWTGARRQGQEGVRSCRSRWVHKP